MCSRAPACQAASNKVQRQARMAYLTVAAVINRLENTEWQIHRPALSNSEYSPHTMIINGRASLLTIYGLPTESNKRSTRAKHSQSLFSQCPSSDYFNTETTWILQGKAANHKKRARQCKPSPSFLLHWWPWIAEIDQHSESMWAAQRPGQVCHFLARMQRSLDACGCPRFSFGCNVLP